MLATERIFKTRKMRSRSLPYSAPVPISNCSCCIRRRIRHRRHSRRTELAPARASAVYMVAYLSQMRPYCISDARARSYLPGNAENDRVEDEIWKACPESRCAYIHATTGTASCEVQLTRMQRTTYARPSALRGQGRNELAVKDCRSGVSAASEKKIEGPFPSPPRSSPDHAWRIFVHRIGGLRSTRRWQFP